MTENQILILILALVYLSECAAWLPAKTFVFDFRKLQKGRVSKPGAGLGNDRGRFYLSNPLPLLAGMHLVPGLKNGSWDVSLAEGRWIQFCKTTRTLELLAFVSFLILFVVVPFTWWKAGANSLSMLATFGTLFLVGLATAIAFFRAHKKLYPAESGARWQHAFLIALVPTHTSRAKDLLARDLFASFHPLVVAKLALPSASFDSFGNWIRRELKFPVSPAKTDEVKLKMVEDFLATQNVLEMPPAKLDDATKFCPRCHAQFGAEATRCEDCGGLALQAFDAQAGSQP